jgi:hypothetical protein
MAAAYEDNFGFWFIDGPEEQAFFAHVQGQSIDAVCKRCERPVRLMPTRDVCAVCICAIECGAPGSISEYGGSKPKTLEPRPGRSRRLAAKGANR